VRLVVFDLDETLTLSTFLPHDKGLRTKLGWSQRAEYTTHVNFESPFLKCSRVERLRALLHTLSERGVVLAVLTRGSAGAIAALNLLQMAGLTEHLACLWGMQRSRYGGECGVYRRGDGEWVLFEPPFDEVPDHKADVLHDIARRPARWFPQLELAAASGSAAARGAAAGSAPLLASPPLRLEEIVLVDDARENFQSKRNEVLRYCQVPKYDCPEHHAGIGFVGNMGGLGALNDSDFDQLIAFVDKPWEHKEKACAPIPCQ